MPAFSTHYFFASDMMTYLKELFDFDINEDSVYIGAQGPDIFFFHRVLPFWRGKPLRKSGSALHRAKCGALLDAMTTVCNETENSDIAKSYICGFILHYALDRCSHPYIYYRQNLLTEKKSPKNPSSAHNAVELSIDSIMLNMHRGSLKPLAEDTTDMIEFNERELEEIGKTAAKMSNVIEKPKFSKDDVKTAILDTKRVQKILSDKTGIKKKFAVVLETLASPFTHGFKVSTMFRTNDIGYAHQFINYENGTWVSPFDDEKKEHTESFFDLYEEAKQDAQKMLTKWKDGCSGEEITNNISFLTGTRVED